MLKKTFDWNYNPSHFIPGKNNSRNNNYIINPILLAIAEVHNPTCNLCRDGNYSEGQYTITSVLWKNQTHVMSIEMLSDKDDDT